MLLETTLANHGAQILVEFLSATSFDASFDSAKAVRDAWNAWSALVQIGYPKNLLVLNVNPGLIKHGLCFRGVFLQLS